MQYICHTRCCDSNDRRGYMEGKTYDLDPARVERLTENGLLPRYFKPYPPVQEQVKEEPAKEDDQLKKLKKLKKGDLVVLAVDYGFDRDTMGKLSKADLMAAIKEKRDNPVAHPGPPPEAIHGGGPAPE